MDIVKFAAIFLIGFSLLFGSKGILAKAQPKEDNTTAVAINSTEAKENSEIKMLSTAIKVDITETEKKPEVVNLTTK